jgi:hypothetical protein
MCSVCECVCVQYVYMCTCNVSVAINLFEISYPLPLNEQKDNFNCEINQLTMSDRGEFCFVICRN